MEDTLREVYVRLYDFGYEVGEVAIRATAADLKTSGGNEFLQQSHFASSMQEILINLSTFINPKTRIKQIRQRQRSVPELKLLLPPEESQ